MMLLVPQVDVSSQAAIQMAPLSARCDGCTAHFRLRAQVDCDLSAGMSCPAILVLTAPARWGGCDWYVLGRPTSAAGLFC